MPLTEHFLTSTRAWGLWKIEESGQELRTAADPCDNLPPEITHEKKMREYLAGRALLKTLAGHLDLPYSGLVKDQYNKPFLKNLDAQLSLSHSYPYVTAIIDRHKSVGIDLEQVKPKLLKVATRILHPEEQRDAGSDMAKHCVYWCAKEALLKIYGKKNLTFAEHIRIEPFMLQASGRLHGQIHADHQIQHVTLHYQLKSDYAFAYTE
jgi:4'-phosphopantetheinyl transferase